MENLAHTRHSSTANNLNQYTSVAAVVLDYDANGNLISDGANFYDYDAENRLAEVTTPAPLSVTYSFDPLDRRVQQAAGTEVTQFLYSGTQEVAEYDNFGNLLRRFVPGAGFGEVVATVEASGERLFHHADALGSTVARSDDLGTMVERYAYGPFGEAAGAPGGTPFRFTGQRFDAETGLYHYRARAYSPALGRFLQTDPIGTEGGVNLYAYVNNDPVNLTDPTGECPWCIAGGVIGGGINLFMQLNSGEDFDFTEFAVATASGALGGGLGTATAKLFVSTGARIFANTVGGSTINAGGQALQNDISGRPKTTGVGEAFLLGAAFSGAGSAVGEAFGATARAVGSTLRSTSLPRALVTTGNVISNFVANLPSANLSPVPRK